LEGKIINEKLMNYEDIERLKSQLNISPIAFKYDGVYNETNNGSQEILFE
jgi:predicted Ser/Thr protein kinase